MSTSQHTYSARTRLLPLLVMLGWLLAGGCLFAFYALLTGTVPAPEKQLGFWAPWLLLSMIAMGFQLDYLRRFRRIEVEEAGLWIGSQGSTCSRLVRWEEIKAIEPFPLPGHPRYGREQGGIRILASSGSVLIYDRIAGYAQLCRAIEEQLCRRDVPVPVLTASPSR